MPSSLTEPLTQLTEASRAPLRASSLRAAVTLCGLGLLLGLLGARAGTSLARAGAGSAIALSLVCVVGWEARQRRLSGDSAGLLRGPVSRVDRERAARAIRALSLLDPAGEARVGRGSPDLVRAHVARVLARLPAKEVMDNAERTAARVHLAAVVVAVCVLALAIARLSSILEGADVLVARRGVAPVSMTWLDSPVVTTRPPEYLHQGESQGAGLQSLTLPYGTSVTVRGIPVRPGRHIFLSDGSSEVPFVEDGSGGLVARWSLTRTVTLGIVARFGDVVIPSPETAQIESVPDESPLVRLEGAPRQLKLIDVTDDIPIRFEAFDDHGLREVHLVLRAGAREERRVLAHLDGTSTSYQGGQVLKLRDPFVARSRVPVAVTVEAKDNDVLTGPKWGRSEALTIVPPVIGEPEARRLEALVRVRDALVDTLAWRLELKQHDEKALATEDAKRTEDDGRLVEAAMSENFSGIRVPPRIRALVGAQEEATRKAIQSQLASPTSVVRAAAVKARERFALVVDAVIRGLGIRDTQSIAKELADVADDLALGAAQLQNQAADVRSRGQARSDAASDVLTAGGSVMPRLGELGQDLGEIVAADLLRVKRARDDRDLVHAELAARDLAARLRQPDPSFGSRGSSRGGVGGGGDEAGAGGGLPGEGDDVPDEVAQAFNEAVQDLERLAQEHAGQIAKTEAALSGEASDDEMKQWRDEAKRHAEAVRGAARRLPRVGAGSDSWTSKGSAARELAEQMAHALEDGRPADAVESGRSAAGTLDEAKKMLQRSGWFEDPSGERQRGVEDARRKLENEAEWAEDELKQLRRHAAERARGPLEQDGADERKLAERASELAERGRDKTSFPEGAVESIEEAERSGRQAAEALQRGDADEGLRYQRDAQREIEAARQELEGEGDDEGSRSNEEGDGRQSSRDSVSIPNAGEHRGPEEFRRRVLRGLAQRTSGSLRDAVQRYAEGLLR
ncbi:MAG: DUF4175 family protein [Polyangiaceae bacterium]